MLYGSTSVGGARARNAVPLAPTQTALLSLLAKVSTPSQYSVVGGTALSATVELSWAARAGGAAVSLSERLGCRLRAGERHGSSRSDARDVPRHDRADEAHTRRDDHRDVQRLTGDDDVGGHPLARNHGRPLLGGRPALGHRSTVQVGGARPRVFAARS